MTNRRTGVLERFDLTARVAVITGGAGLLGSRHAAAVSEAGGVPVILDIAGDRAQERAEHISAATGGECLAMEADASDREAMSGVLDRLLEARGRVDILVNNAARDPKVGPAATEEEHWTRFEHFPLDAWDKDIEVGLTSALVCSQVIGGEMARRGRGVILNIASDLAVIAPDQRIYREPGTSGSSQAVKPVSYSVVKHGLIGLTRYLATYWADSGLRVNALSPGGVHNDQEPGFVARLSNLVPMGRMAHVDEYKAAVVFLVSDASSYMTGANVVMDGGRSTW